MALYRCGGGKESKSPETLTIEFSQSATVDAYRHSSGNYQLYTYDYNYAEVTTSGNVTKPFETGEIEPYTLYSFKLSCPKTSQQSNQSAKATIVLSKR